MTYTFKVFYKGKKYELDVIGVYNARMLAEMLKRPIMVPIYKKLMPF